MSTTQIDDRDSSITYLPADQWLGYGTANEFNGTTMFTHNMGATATLVFNGTAITVLGTVPGISDDPKISYSAATLFNLDNGKILAPYSVEQLPSKPMYNQIFFSVFDLSPESLHTLVILMANSGNFYLDLIELNGTPVQTLISSIQATSSSVSFIQPTSSPTSTPSASPSWTSTPASSETANPAYVTQATSVPHGPMKSPLLYVIGALLALIGCAFIVFVFCFIRRRQRHRMANSSPATGNLEVARPFTVVSETPPPYAVKDRVSDRRKRYRILESIGSSMTLR